MASPQLPLWDRPTFVYRAFAPTGLLLYVGISQQWRNRIDTHSQTSEWYRYTKHLEIDLYADRQQAFAAESWSLANERPAWNREPQTKHVPPQPPTPLQSFGRLARKHMKWSNT